MPKLISRSRETLIKTSGKNSGKFFTTGTEIFGLHVFDPYNMVETPLKVHPTSVYTQNIQPLGIEFPFLHSKTGSHKNWNLTTPILQSMDANQACNQSIPKMTS